jgi:hypothetical protein
LNKWRETPKASKSSISNRGKLEKLKGTALSRFNQFFAPWKFQTVCLISFIFRGEGRGKTWPVANSFFSFLPTFRFLSSPPPPNLG